MLDAIRAIVTGRIDAAPATPAAGALLNDFCDAGRARSAELTPDLPPASPPRFPHGHYEMGFGLMGATPARTLVELRERLARARSVKHAGGRRPWT